MMFPLRRCVIKVEKQQVDKFVRKYYVMHALGQEGVQKAEATSQLEDWNMESKGIESRSQIGEFENGNAEE